MTLKQELFTQIKIAKDGNCLFRSLVIFLNETLLKTRRNRTGFPTNTKYHDYEDASALFQTEKIAPHTSGSLYVSLPPVSSSLLTAQDYVYDVLMTSGSITRRIIEGKFIVRPSVTR